MVKDEIIGWEFMYILSDKIDCDKDIRDMEDVKFVTDDDQNAITKFKIMVRIQDHVDARQKVDQMAARLISLLVALSDKPSMHNLKGWDEIKASGKRKVVSVLTGRLQRPNHAIRNIEPTKFRNILNTDNELAEKMHYIARAWQASKVHDYASVVKHLHMACKEDLDTVCKDDHDDQLKKFQCLRNALSHSDGPLKKGTIKGLKGFGDGYFTLTDAGRFDFSSTSNLRNLKFQASKLLRCVHTVFIEDLS